MDGSNVPSGPAVPVAFTCGALTSADLVSIVPFEMSSAAVGYGNLGGVCHFMTAVGGPNTCLPAAGGGTASSIQVYSPQVKANAISLVVLRFAIAVALAAACAAASPPPCAAAAAAPAELNCTSRIFPYM